MRLRFKLLPVAVSLVLLPSLAHSAQFRLTGLDGIMSTVVQQHQSSFSGLALRGRVVSDRLMEGFVLMPTLEWWRSSNRLDAFGIESSRKDATLGMDMRYEFRREGIKPYLGAGFGIHFLSSNVNAPTLGLTNASNSLMKGGLSALAGASFGLSGKLDNFLEIKYHNISDYRQFKINWGLAYNL